MEDYLAAKERLQRLSRQRKSGSSAAAPQLPASSSSASSSPVRSSPRRPREHHQQQQHHDQHHESLPLEPPVRDREGGGEQHDDASPTDAATSPAAMARLDLEATMQREKDLAQQLDESEADLERSVRTAGLRRARENALLEEVRALRTLRTRHLSAVADVRASSEAALRHELQAQAKRQLSAELGARVTVAVEAEARRGRDLLERHERACMARANEVIRAAQEEHAGWREEREQQWRDETNQAVEQSRRAADERVRLAEERFTARVHEVRRGADARVAISTESAAAMKQELEPALRAEREATAKAADSAAAASRAAGLEHRIADLEGRLVKATSDASVVDARAETRVSELEKLLGAARARADKVELDFNNLESMSARRREHELADLDARVRRALASKQALIDRLRTEKDEAVRKGEEASVLLQSLEKGLQEC